MASYRIEFKSPVKKDLKAIPRQDAERILRASDDLKTDLHPYNLGKLTSRNAWRFRVGRYRIIYTINDEGITILIINVGHRKSIYR